MAKKAKTEVPAELNVPKDWVPLIEWTKWFYDKQKLFTRSIAENFETMLKAGNGAGKTRIEYWNMIAWALGIHPYMAETVKMNPQYGLKRGLPNPPLRFKVLVTDFEHGLDQIAYETLRLSTTMPDGSVIGPILPKSAIIQEPTKDEKTYKLRAANNTVSEIFFMTSEQKRRLHSGTNFDALWCDEEPVEKAYDESKRGLRNAKGGGRLIMSFTPPLPDDITQGPTWTRHKIYLPFKNGEVGPPSVNVIECRMTDNPAISEEFVREFSRGKSEQEVSVQINGDYPRWGRLVHPDFNDSLWDFKAQTGNLFKKAPPPPDARVFMALDWHRSKPCVAVWAYETRDNDLVIFEELRPEEVKAKTISQVAQIILNVEKHQFPNMMKPYRIGDPKMKDTSNEIIAGLNAWQEFRRNGIFLNEGWNRQPETGISQVNDYISGDTKTHPRLFVMEHCEFTRLYLREHYWVTDRNGNADPDNKWSDYPICIRYIVQHRAGRTSKTSRNTNRWGLTSYDRMPGYQPYQMREGRV